MKYNEYTSIVFEQLNRQVKEEEANIRLAADFCAATVMKDRVIHVFGCGHSQMFPMELFYRAGGLAQVNALLVPPYSLNPIAILSTMQERIEGFAGHYLNTQNVSADDTMIIVSVSGRNAAVIDMAIEAKNIGMKVVVLTSKEFSGSVSSRHSTGKMLKDFADVVIDLKCVKGDAALSMEGMPSNFNGTSTILGMTVVNLISAQTIENCVNAGYIPPVYVSSNLNEGDQINADIIRKYRDKIDCL